MSKVVSNNAILKYNNNQEIKTCDVSTIVESGLKVSKRAITADDGVIEAGDGETEATGIVGKDRKIIYEVELSNFSTKEFNNIVITDTIVLPDPYQTSFSVTELNGYANTGTKPNLVFTVPTLESESTAVVRYEIKLDDTVPAGILVNNQALASYNENPSTDPVKSEKINVTVDYTEIKAEKTSSESSVLFGQDYDYVITFENTGSQVINPSTIEDTLPPNFNIKSIQVYIGEDLKEIDTHYTKTEDTDSVTKQTKLTITPVDDNLNIPADKTLKVVVNGNVSE